MSKFDLLCGNRIGAYSSDDLIETPRTWTTLELREAILKLGIPADGAVFDLWPHFEDRNGDMLGLTGFTTSRSHGIELIMNKKYTLSFGKLVSFLENYSGDVHLCRPGYRQRSRFSLVPCGLVTLKHAHTNIRLDPDPAEIV